MHNYIPSKHFQSLISLVFLTIYPLFLVKISPSINKTKNAFEKGNLENLQATSNRGDL